ncbi:STM4504/CBY_0614 family protein [Novosphingobium sp. 9U]|uniref:STM4504/CBY_0614 family protein n=1 Tax=Novosphingobium sp. 9U TaxID=2653158 RepID=UPI0012EFBA42|nr:hypothetical protein [Novosphingobium sp. 9U]VWX46619.1 conserved hypothetical protein [Novosphingobium sp. 9U]
MALPQLFSRRRRQQSGPASDIYSYDSVPGKVRVQIVHLIIEGLGRHDQYSANAPWWAFMLKTMRKEKGVFHLTDGFAHTTEEYCNWLLAESDIPTFLDGIEVAFQAIKAMKGEYREQEYGEIENELNARLAEAAVGYQLKSGSIIQLDREIIHKEVVMPALQLLADPRFAGANDEYLDAHRFYRDGDFESCLIECGKAFESVLKVIGGKRNWAITPNDAASKLVSAAFTSGFIPNYMQGQFTALRAVLEAGVPVVRNRMSGHGAGGQVRQVDRHLAAYQLHQTAAAIVFLVDHDRLTP